MKKFIVKSSSNLKGEIEVNGAKNAALPIMAASILTDQPLILSNVPTLSDVENMGRVLKNAGICVRQSGSELRLTNTGTNVQISPYELTNKLRASFLVAGPMCAKYGYAKISLPGGCPIGVRPVDLHLKGLAKLGAEISIDNGFVEISAQKLTGAKIYLDFPSVGATENLMMAATLAEGQTIIENAATEPEITDLANLLNKMGATIKGAGTDCIRILGVPNLTGATHSIIPDRIEAGTYMVLTAGIGGRVRIKNVVCEHLRPVSAKLREMGVYVEEFSDEIYVKSSGKVSPVDIKTLPFPGFPTDMQAQFASVLANAKGTSVITETIFENRFMHLCELRRMGADVKIDGRCAVIDGVKQLSGAKVNASDLRAGASLIIAAAMAQGESEITGIEYIDRGYSKIENKLQEIGLNIERV